MLDENKLIAELNMVCNHKLVEQNYEQERELYHLQNAELVDCTFAGPADGESALKETSHIILRDSWLSLRYSLWHMSHFRMAHTTLDTDCRAPMWYSREGLVENCEIYGIKWMRECEELNIRNCTIKCSESAWKCRDLVYDHCDIDSPYFLLDSERVTMRHCKFTGKYSFQYMQDVCIEDSELDSKDIFWHSKNVIVKNCTLKGEYIGWYSDGLTFENCTIIGTQPFCYCKNLKLVNCKLVDADLAFEYSDVEADLAGELISVKNPKSGHIVADTIGEIILENSIMDCTCEIHARTE